MTKKRLLLLCLFLSCSSLFAHEATIFHQDSLNYLQKNAMAIQFGVSNYFNLTTFAGSSFSFKYHFSKKIALRVVCSLSAGINNQITDIDSNATSGFDSDQDNNYYGIGLKLAVVYYPKPFYNATPYFGLGPLIEHRHTYQKSNDTSTLDLDRKTEHKRNQWNVGISVLAGAELFIRRNISIHAEYFALLYYLQYEDINNKMYDDPESPDTKQTAKYDGYRFEGSRVYFGLSLYF